MAEIPNVDPIQKAKEHMGTRVEEHINDLSSLLQRVNKITQSSEILNKSARHFASHEGQISGTSTAIRNMQRATTRLHLQVSDMRDSLQSLKDVEGKLAETLSVVPVVSAADLSIMSVTSTASAS